jgi:hypothetical protein
MRHILSVITLFALFSIFLVTLGLINPDNTIFTWCIVVGLCILLGIAIKLMDILIDEVKNRNYKFLIIPLAVFIPTAMAYLALSEEPVVGMVLGTVIGLLLAGKLDHPMYIVSVVFFIIFIFIANIMSFTSLEITTIYIIPVAATGSFLDEFGHEKYDRGDILSFMFKHRFFLKIFAFLGFLLGFAQLVHLIGFLCFDLLYDILESAWQSDIKRIQIMPCPVKVD